MNSDRREVDAGSVLGDVIGATQRRLLGESLSFDLTRCQCFFRCKCKDAIASASASSLSLNVLCNGAERDVER